MSKQSREKSRRHHKTPTGAKAPTFAQTFKAMGEANRYHTKAMKLNELHDILYARKSSWGINLISIFHCEMWWTLEAEVLKKRDSKSKARALQLLDDIKAIYYV